MSRLRHVRSVAVLLALIAALSSTVMSAGGAEAASRQRLAQIVFGGLGGWIDHWEYDDRSAVTMNRRIDAMAAYGVQTLYLQASTPRTGLLGKSPAKLKAMIAQAERRRMRIVLWYLPTTTSIAVDLAHLRAAAQLRYVDAIAVDAESDVVKRVSERNRRLIAVVEQIRKATSKPVGVITPSPTAMALWSPTWWPGYPIAALGRTSDAMLTMTYWGWHTHQTTAAAQTEGDISRVRAAVGDAMPIHVIGWPTSASDIVAFCGVLRARRAAGGSVYDAASTPRAVARALSCAHR